MEKFKSFLQKFRSCKSPEETREKKDEHVITIDDNDLQTVVTQANKNEQRQGSKYDLLIDVLFCCMVVLFWTTIFRFFIQLMMQEASEQIRIQQFLSIILCLMIIVTLNSLQFECSLLKRFKNFTPKVSLVLRRSRYWKSHILRIRLLNEEEFLETEITKDELTYDRVVEACCKELNLKREQIKRLWKIPETLIRSDLDVKRFSRIEYIEVHV